MRPSQLTSLLLKSIPAKMPILVTGQPGCGKTDVISATCEQLGADLILEHPVVSDPTDAKGIPWVVDGEAVFLPIGNLEKLMNAKKLTVCFIDDLGQAPHLVQAAYMQLILARRINGHEVSPHVCFVAATNRRTDRAGVSGVIEPMKSRFSTIVPLDISLDDWVQWALQNDIPVEFIAFARFRPDVLSDFKPTNDLTNSGSPRTFANAVKMYQLGLPQEIEYETLAGSIGEGFAAELVGFLKIFRSLPNPDSILMNPEKADVPTDPATLYATCGALARKASEQTIGRLVTYANRLSAEFSVLLIRDCVGLAPGVVNSRSFIEWSSRNSEVLL